MIMYGRVHLNDKEIIPKAATETEALLNRHTFYTDDKMFEYGYEAWDR